MRQCTVDETEHFTSWLEVSAVGLFLPTFWLSPLKLQVLLKKSLTTVPTDSTVYLSSLTSGPGAQSFHSYFSLFCWVLMGCF